MRRILALTSALALAISFSAAADTYDNGPLVTNPGGGFGGADLSMLQNVSLGLGTLGFGHQTVNQNRVADDFTVTHSAGWSIKNFTFYAYQTDAPVDPSTILDVNYRIWDGVPGAGGAIIHDFSVGSSLLSSSFSGIYRAAEATPLNAQRPIMENLVDGNGITLGPGTYWVDWQAGGALSSGPWAPPISILGQAVTGNGRQFLGPAGGNIWQDAVDGNDFTAFQGFPFQVEYNVVPAPAAFAVLAGLLAGTRRRRGA